MEIGIIKTIFNKKCSDTFLKEIVGLAQEFGLPCIEREDRLEIIGELNTLVFNKAEEKTMTLSTSPVGQIKWMAASNPVTDKKTGKESYSIKLSLDVKKDKDWLAQISEINDAKVVTAQTYRGKSAEIKADLATGKAYVEAKSKFKPTVYDVNGNELEDAPMFFSESTGTAQMIVEPYVGEKGGTINLVGIIIHSVESPEGTTDTTDRATRLEQLRAAVAAATN